MCKFGQVWCRCCCKTEALQGMKGKAWGAMSQIGRGLSQGCHREVKGRPGFCM
jgi:hypothetical protein